MSFDLSFDPSSVADLARLAAAGPALDAEIARALAELGPRIQAEIEGNMNFTRGNATGNLESSLQIAGDGPLDLQVGTDVPYAKFVEYGTGRRGAASGVTPEPGYSYGPRPGMAAEPYMAPTVPQVEPVVMGRLEQAVLDALALSGTP